MFLGIDVSKHNGVIDWDKVKAAGVQFAMIRAGYGQNNIDSKFKINILEPIHSKIYRIMRGNQHIGVKIAARPL